MLSSKMSTFALYLTVMVIAVSAFDVPYDARHAANSFRTQDPLQQKGSTSDKEENAVVEFLLKYSGSWAPYLTQLTSDLGEAVRDMAFHLLDSLSSFPLTTLETFCVTGVCLSFFVINVILNNSRGQSDRVAALEREIASLRENTKMNRVLINEKSAESQQAVINDLRDKIKDVMNIQISYSEFRKTVDTKLHHIKQEINNLNAQIQGLQNRQLNTETREFQNRHITTTTTSPPYTDVNPSSQYAGTDPSSSQFSNMDPSSQYPSSQFTNTYQSTQMQYDTTHTGQLYNSNTSDVSQLYQPCQYQSSQQQTTAKPIQDQHYTSHLYQADTVTVNDQLCSYQYATEPEVHQTGAYQVHQTVFEPLQDKTTFESSSIEPVQHQVCASPFQQELAKCDKHVFYHTISEQGHDLNASCNNQMDSNRQDCISTEYQTNSLSDSSENQNCHVAHRVSHAKEPCQYQYCHEDNYQPGIRVRKYRRSLRTKQMQKQH